MDAGRKPRKRSKSTSLKDNSPAIEPEVAADLNGDNPNAEIKAGAEPEVQEPKDEKPKSETEGNEAPVKGRKRKASEINNDSITEQPKKEAKKDDKEPVLETDAKSEEKTEEKKDKGMLFFALKCV